MHADELQQDGADALQQGAAGWTGAKRATAQGVATSEKTLLLQEFSLVVMGLQEVDENFKKYP